MIDPADETGATDGLLDHRTMPKKTIEQVDVAGKRVLMRVDFNVPIEGGRIADDRRIREALPSIRSVLNRGGSLVLMSHLGRPEETGFEAEHSLVPVAKRLGELLGGAPVTVPHADCVSAESAAAVAGLRAGGALVLENLRFNAGETKNDKAFAARLAAYGDIYCNDAFGTAHRDHASMTGVPEAMAGKPRVAGLLMIKELKFLGDALAAPARPFVAVLGGAKVSDKMGVIRNLYGKVNAILIGGAMAYTFLKAMGREVGASKAQLGMLDDARRLIDGAAASHTDLVLPVDHVCGREVTRHTPVRVFKDDIEPGWMGLDIGPDTITKYTTALIGAKTVVWNGPMGVFETPPFDVGTRRVAEAVAQATAKGAMTIVGGGDSAAAVEAFGLAAKFSHVSTGGGASLEFLEGKAFNSIRVLDNA
jgi:phosphoglycerate kinase